MKTQISELTEAIRALAAALTQTVPAMPVPVDSDQNFLYTLYHVEYLPVTAHRCEADEVLVQDVEDTRDRLTRFLPPLGEDRLSEYEDAMVRYNSVVMERSYEAGFKTAVQMMAAGLSNDLK